MSKDTPKTKPTFLLLLLLTFFVQSTLSLTLKGTTGITAVDYPSSGNTVTSKMTGAYEKQRFRLDFPNTEVPRGVNYVRVDLKKETDIPMPILHFSSTDDNCESGRQQIVKNPNNDTISMYLKTEEFMDGDLFVVVELVKTDGQSDYSLTFTGSEQLDIESNFVYSYLVGTGNKRMEVSADVSQNQPDAVTIYAFGSKSMSLVVDGVSGVTKFENGAAVTFTPQNENSALYSFSINANEGEYVTFGISNVKDGKTEKSLLEPNGNEVCGLLVKEVLEDQCFEMSTLEELYKNKKIYITGRFYSKFAQVYYRDSSFKEIEDSAKNVTDGFFTGTLSTSGKKNSICVRFIPNAYSSVKNIPFSLYVTEPTTIEDKYKFYPPQVLGQIYKRILPKNTGQIFTSLAPPANKRIMYNLKMKTGFPLMFTEKCSTYPYCTYKEEDFDNIDSPTKANRMFTFSFGQIEDTKPLSNEKQVMYVFCRDDDNAGSGYCEFETLFMSLNDVIDLVEDETFGQYLIKDDKGSFKISLENDSTWRTLNIDIMVHSGDASFDISSDSGSVVAKKYYLSNKVYYKVESEENNDLSNIIISYKASLNSYFTIRWNANRQGDATQYRDYLVSGFSYLVDLDPTAVIKTKTIKLMNLRHKDNKPFLANFFALNCDYKLERDGTEIKFYDGYAQEVLTSSSAQYNQDYYDYVLTIKDADLSNYNNKMCMIYVAGMEYGTEVDDVTSEILISENINQQVIFENGMQVARFLYIQPDSTKDLVLKLNVIDTSIYHVGVYVEWYLISFVEVSRSKIIHLKSSEYQKYCYENTQCAFVIQIYLEKDLIGTNPMIEVTIRPILNIPTYLQKGQAKQDFVCGERAYYLYTDVGKNEEGEILVDFMRGAGEVFAKVVRKDQTNADEEANWRDIYRMPSSEWGDSLPYNNYLKKLILNTEDTGDCNEGCYLLVTIQLAQTDTYIEDYRFFPFSIITRVTPANRAYTDIPKVVIQCDEYIVGNVDVSENSERIYQFYEIWLPHDSEVVDFDWQSGVAGMYINLGGTRPTTKNADFKLLPHSFDQVLMLSKSEIIEKAKTKQVPLPLPNSIQDVNLVIGIWTDRADSVDTELFSLRVHQPIRNELNIVEVNSYQKVLCRPENIADDRYRCLFMIVYEESQSIQNVLAYGASTDESATNYIYATFIDKTMYDSFKTTELQAKIPTTSNSDLNSEKDNVDYIFSKTFDNTKYLYVSVVTDSADDIMFLSYLGDYNYLTFPNPSSEQLIAVLPVHQMSLQFNTEMDVIINIISLTGHAEVYWGNDEDMIYQLYGRGDALTITSGSYYKDGRRCNLMVRNRNPASAKTNMADPGFVFYVSYSLRDPEINFDEVSTGKSIEMAYKDTDFPLYLYSKIYEVNSDMNVVLTFHNVTDNGEDRLFFENSPFNFNGMLVKESVAYLAKKNPELRPSYDKSIVGVYDPAVSTAQVFLSLNDLNTFNIKYDDRPTLYFGLDKSSFNKLTYSKFSFEASVMRANDDVSPIDNVYNYGKIDKSTGKNYFRLRTDKNKQVMRVQLSFNSESLDFVISESRSVERNMTFSEVKRSYGKVIITINVPSSAEYLYLIIYVKNDELASDRRLNNYCFKYINAETASSLKEYKVKSDYREITTTFTDSGDLTNINVVFSPIDNNENLNIVYYLKVVPNDTHVYKESYDTVAVSESPASVVAVRNYSKSEGTVKIDIYNVTKLWVYIEVVAKIEDGDNIDYVCYEGKHEVRPYTPSNGGSNGGGVNTVVFLVVGGVLLVIIIGLAIAFFIFKQRNQALLNQVKHVSFQKTNSNTDPNLLLNKPSQGAPS